MAAAGLGGDGLGVERGGARLVLVGAGLLTVRLGVVAVRGLCVVGVLVRGALRGAVADGQAGEAGREAGEEGDEADGDGGADGGGVGGGGLGGDGHEGGEGSGGGDEGGRDEGGVAAGGERDQGDRGDQGADAAEQELEAPGSLADGRGDDPGAGDHQVREGAEAERDGGEAVAVDAGAHSGDGGEQDADGARDDPGQAVHVVQQRIGVPEDEAQHDEQHGGAGQARAAQHVVAPAVPVADDGGGDGVGHVVEHGGRQGLGEGAQAQHLAVEDLLAGEGPGAVEDGAGAAYEVEAGRGAHRLGLAGEAQQLGVDVGDGDVLGEGDVDATVGGHDGDPAETRRCGRTHLCDPPG